MRKTGSGSVFASDSSTGFGSAGRFRLVPTSSTLRASAEKLVIEVDGGQHGNRIGRDETRTAWLAASGFRVLRFWNNDVLANTEGVLQTILDALEGRA